MGQLLLKRQKLNWVYTMAKNYHCVLWRNEYTIFDNWSETKKFMKGKEGVKNKGFNRKKDAEQWAESQIFDEEKDPDIEPELPFLTDTSPDYKEAGRLFKLIADEYRNFTRNGTDIEIKKVCLCFDKLSQIFGETSQA